MNWLVERTPNDFETVKANRYKIEGGALIFYDDGTSPARSHKVGFAAGAWLTFVHEED